MCVPDVCTSLKVQNTSVKNIKISLPNKRFNNRDWIDGLVSGRYRRNVDSGVFIFNGIEM